MNPDDVVKFEGKLRGVEGTLEELGRSICSVNGGLASYTDINRALDSVRNAIRNAYLMANV